MLSYQHGFHAGNFADVHKHLILEYLLDALNRKAKPWSYIETHAGRGMYELQSDQALKTSEFRSGIGALWQSDLPPSLKGYLEQVKLVNETGELTHYPGSPLIAAQMARDLDKLHLMELHPQEAIYLQKQFRKDSRVGVHKRDGFEGALSLLPPKPNRGILMVDPAYEVKTEYDLVVSFLDSALRRWPNGCFAIWYPLLAANRWQSMLDNLLAVSGSAGVLDSRLQLTEPQDKGMYGSGMVLINPPWQIDQKIKSGVEAALSLMNASKPVCKLSWLRIAA